MAKKESGKERSKQTRDAAKAQPPVQPVSRGITLVRATIELCITTGIALAQGIFDTTWWISGVCLLLIVVIVIDLALHNQWSLRINRTLMGSVAIFASHMLEVRTFTVLNG